MQKEKESEPTAKAAPTRRKRRTALNSREANQRQAQAKATRQLLIQTARSLFASQGYHMTGTEELVEKAGVTRGALYHHFRDKMDLFEAVFEQIQAELVDLTPRPRPSGAVKTGWTDFRTGTQSYLDVTLQADVQRIVLIDGPSVLGWAKWRSIQLRYGLQHVVNGLQAAMDEGSLPRQPAVLLAQLVLALLEEAASIIAHSDEPRAMRNKVGATLDRMLQNMTIHASPRSAPLPKRY